MTTDGSGVSEGDETEYSGKNEGESRDHTKIIK